MLKKYEKRRRRGDFPLLPIRRYWQEDIFQLLLEVVTGLGRTVETAV
jgi:hypothetical protein